MDFLGPTAELQARPERQASIERGESMQLNGNIKHLTLTVKCMPLEYCVCCAWKQIGGDPVREGLKDLYRSTLTVRSCHFIKMVARQKVVPRKLSL
jgi:hypothetical protein